MANNKFDASAIDVSSTLRKIATTCTMILVPLTGKEYVYHQTSHSLRKASVFSKGKKQTIAATMVY